MKGKIILASSNRGKIKEISAMLEDYEVIGYKDAGYTGGEIEETGKTFYENALIKAKTVALALGVPALSDDSGICVDALGGAPGIYSARYAGTGDDVDNCLLLLENLKGQKNRRAKFVCTMVYYMPSGVVFSATGETHGSILQDFCGNNGFGYDPIFYSDDLKKSMGEATEEEKNSVSHRYRALLKIKELL